MNVGRSSLKLLVAKSARAVVTFGGIVYFAQRIDPAQLGVFFLFQAALELLALPADLGLRGAVEKRISEGTDPGEVLTAAALLKFAPLTVVGGLLLAFGNVFEGYLGADIARYLVAGLLLQEYARLTVHVLNGEMRVGETAVILLSQRIVWLVTGVMLVDAGYGARGLIYGLLAGYAVMLFWGAAKRSTPFHRPARRHVASLYEYARFNVVSQIGGAVYGWMDVAVIGLLLTPALVGAYEVAWRLTAFVVLFSHSLATAIFPQVSRWNAEDASEQIENLLPEIVVWSLVPVVPAFVGTVLLSKNLLLVLFGPEYVVAWVALSILMGEKILQAVHVVLGRSLLGIDRPDLAARATAVAVVLNLALNVALVPFLGIAGAALATAVSFAVNTVLHARYLSRFLTIKLRYRDIGWCTISSVGMGATLAFVLSRIAVDSLSVLLTVVACGVLVYGALMFVSYSFRRRATQVVSAFS